MEDGRASGEFTRGGGPLGYSCAVRCPKCSFEQPDGAAECARCGVVFAKLERRRWRETTAPVPPDPPPPPPPPTPGGSGPGDDPDPGEPERPDASSDALPDLWPGALVAPSDAPSDAASGGDAPVDPSLETATPPARPSSSGDRKPAGRRAALRHRILDLALEVPDEVDRVHFVGRAMLFALAALMGLRLLVAGVATYPGVPILDMANLVFHEAGHILFAPFGDFLRVLGGSLLQCLIPALCCAAFLLQTRDPFGAAMALWWLGQNLMDLAPYIADARSGQLLLLGGVTGRDVPGYHDWENLLGTLGLLQQDQALGALAYLLGRLVVVVALVWAGRLLVLQARRLEKPWW